MNPGILSMWTNSTLRLLYLIIILLCLLFPQLQAHPLAHRHHWQWIHGHDHYRYPAFGHYGVWDHYHSYVPFLRRVPAPAERNNDILSVADSLVVRGARQQSDALRRQDEADCAAIADREVPLGPSYRKQLDLFEKALRRCLESRGYKIS